MAGHEDGIIGFGSDLEDDVITLLVDGFSMRYKIEARVNGRNCKDRILLSV